MHFNVLFQIKTLESLITKIFIKEISKDKTFSNKIPTQSQVKIIEYIINSNNEVYQRDLENIFSYSRSTISGILNTMEKNGLILRDTSIFDSRIKKIVLTPETKIIFEKAKKHLDTIEELMIKDISNSEIQNFSLTILKMKDNLKNL